jgi:hypothetical protein
VHEKFGPAFRTPETRPNAVEAAQSDCAGVQGLRAIALEKLWETKQRQKSGRRADLPCWRNGSIPKC